MPEEITLHPDTEKLVDEFAAALKQKLLSAQKKYGYGASWKNRDFVVSGECNEALCEHLDKGDPRDVAAYCAFLWYHGGYTTSGPLLESFRVAQPRSAQRLEPSQNAENPEMMRLAVELAVDGAWSGVECASIVEREGEIEWFNVGEDAESLEDEMRLLVGLRLAELHAAHPEWIREIAEL